MKTTVLIGEQVRDFLGSLSPEPRRRLWRGIKNLASDEGDRLQLEGSLAPFWRLRVDRMRVVYFPRSVKGERQIVCFFADHRATVYSVLGQLLASGLLDEMKKPGQ